MRFADIWFSALLVLLIPTRSSVALATAKSSGLFGIPAGGSTKLSHTQIQAASIDISADAPATVSSITESGASEVRYVDCLF